MRIRLGDEDRARLGCEEWLEFDPRRFSNLEAREIRRFFGVTTRAWFDGYEKGEPPVADDGHQLSVFDTFHCYTWIALHRAGHKVRIDDLEFDILQISRERGEDEDDADGEAGDEAGKDEPGETTPAATIEPSSSSSTNPPSAPSGAG